MKNLSQYLSRIKALEKALDESNSVNNDFNKKISSYDLKIEMLTAIISKSHENTKYYQEYTFEIKLINDKLKARANILETICLILCASWLVYFWIKFIF